MPQRARQTVRFVGWRGYDAPLTFGGYPETHGLALERSYIWDDQAVVDRLLAGELGTVDIASPDLKFVPRMIAAGLCEEIDVERLPNYGKLLPHFVAHPELTSGGRHFAVPFTWGAHPMIYRPDLVTERPTSWLDALRPEYKGKVIMVGDYGGNLPAWAPVVTGVEDPARLTRRQVKETIDFLIKIKKEHACAFTTDYLEMVEIMARGDAVISTLGWEPQVRWAAARGARLDMAYPKEGTSGYLDVYVIPRNAPNYEATHELIDNALSTGAQIALAEELDQGVVNGEAIPHLAAHLQTRYAYGDPKRMSRVARFTPAPPTEENGTHATLALLRSEWERFKAA